MSMTLLLMMLMLMLMIIVIITIINGVQFLVATACILEMRSIRIRTMDHA